MTPVILGYGNPDRGDDAAGPLVAQRLRDLGIDARVFTFDGLSLFQSWHDLDDVVVVDAVMTGSKPGTIFEWPADEVPLDRIGFPTSTHSFGLAEAIELGRALNSLPRRLHVVGIEARDFTLGHPPSPEVMDAIGAAADLIAKNYKLSAAIARG
jgi:hydrogenase maturation protease